ncbi:MAG: UDP-N-acetylglucosamine 2-epimerase (non-hydrolyzing) [Sedimentisphaerales bacterium]|nr:UDP-N-acetylglucosamine 2-epimerase (non-hydrolyzing) [Sedimentisphaerales bacterium]
MKRVLFIFGTRPEAIKLCPVIKCMEQHAAFEVKVCVTAQHRQMLDQVLEIFNVEPDYDLNLMKPNQTLFDITASAITGLKSVLEDVKPDVVLVQGDTTTVFAGALASYYLKIPVGHVEAGLRTDNKYSPFPEEVNRRLTSVMTDYHFAPTSASKQNLLREGYSETSIFVTGNTVIDALLWVKKLIDTRTLEDFPELQGLTLTGKSVLITGHRRENFGAGFDSICNAIKTLALKHADVSFVYPVHLNPNVRKPVFERLGAIENIKLIEPLSYLPFVYLMNQSTIVLTDSGGVQEEAPSLGKPVLVMRDTTERPEAVHAGTAKLVGTQFDMIVQETERLLTDPNAYSKMANAVNPYGDGNAAERIANILSGNRWHPFNTVA